jgi:hypothetical protein
MMRISTCVILRAELFLQSLWASHLCYRRIKQLGGLRKCVAITPIDRGDGSGLEAVSWAGDFGMGPMSG